MVATLGAAALGRPVCRRARLAGAKLLVADASALRSAQRRAARPSSSTATRAVAAPALQQQPWTPLRLPRSLAELRETLTSPAVTSLASDPQALRYAGYTALRSVFFTANAVTAALLTSDRIDGAFRRFERQGGADAATGAVAAEGLLRVLESQAELYRRDLANIQEGLYRAPYDMNPAHRQFSPTYIADKASRLLATSRKLTQLRNQEEGGTDVRRTATDAAVYGTASATNGVPAYPDYYLRNFHYQPGGWFSVASSKSYEFQTETLFTGSQDAMQRASLAPLGRYMRQRGSTTGAGLSLLEVAAGTGRFHTFVKDNWPEMATTCSDLSPYYLAEARENVEYFADFNAEVNPGRSLAPTSFVQCAAEQLPFADASFDVLLNVYMFHEMPSDARVASIKEFARVVKPGGMVIVNDSLQQGDRPEVDAVLPMFPATYHEPYYMDYVQADIPALFAEAGMQQVHIELAHVSKCWAFVKPSHEGGAPHTPAGHDDGAAAAAPATHVAAPDADSNGSSNKVFA